jgi:D-alanyl-lipoteichoic acid acyltransferase DltB (MBOAT superfamily)
VLFNSTEFLFFYVATFALYCALAPFGAWRLQKLLLLIASLLFYMSWSVPFVLLLLGMVTVCFVTGLAVTAASGEVARRRRLAIGVGASLAILAYFKYRGFLLQNLAFLDLGHHRRLGEVLLPLGISFYTFHAISYMVDVYRRAIVAHRNFLDVALYVAFFPQLVAGPITRASQFLPQLASPRRPSAAGAERALMLIALGLFKKVVCADVLGEYVDQVFKAVAAQPGVNLGLGAYAYAFQIYFDFSGYSDMAIGLAALLGFELPINFRLPYVATDPSDFWRRWHISLSTWLRDYLYVPLGGNRRGRGRTYVHLLLTMVLGGLWHGPAWNYVAWGAYHGGLLAGHRWWRERRTESLAVGVPRGRLFLHRLAMFHLVCVGWVIFRAESAGDIAAYFGGLARPGVMVTPAFVRAVVWTALAFVIHQLCAERDFARRFLALPPVAQAASYATVAVLTFVFSPVSQRFIYFQF